MTVHTSSYVPNTYIGIFIVVFLQVVVSFLFSMCYVALYIVEGTL